MGTWGGGLYEDDVAADLRDTVAQVVKVPVDGAKLLEILRAMHGTEGLDDIDDQTFWLVLADQFERRGIGCADVMAAALSIIGDGRNLKDLEALGADRKTVAQRSKALDALAGRLRSPRPVKPRKTPAKAPDMFLKAGEIYAFPAMGGMANRPWRSPDKPPFAGTEWGALVVLETGRAFDWLPWCAVASLTVEPTRKPALQDALSGRLIFHLQTQGAVRCVPTRNDIRTMGLELLGCVAIDPTKAGRVLSRWGVVKAIECGWPVSYAGFTRDMQGLPVGCHLSELVGIPD